MKISKNFKLKNIAGTYAVIPQGDGVVDFSAMITTNEMGAYLWELLENDTTIEEMTEKVLSEFDVDRETAIADIIEFTKKLEEQKVLE